MSNKNLVRVVLDLVVTLFAGSTLWYLTTAPIQLY
jgi:NADH:ubiquinone oxidoreductase subunit 6 (subunit J)